MEWLKVDTRARDSGRVDVARARTRGGSLPDEKATLGPRDLQCGSDDG